MKPSEDNEEGKERRSSSRCNEERRLMKTMKNEYNSMKQRVFRGFREE